jgi:alanyl-tRNA synthetase
MKNGFIFFINIKNDDSVNFIAKSNSKINAGMIVKDASMTSNGNGGGSPTFAQGGGKTSDKVDEIIEKIVKVIKSND